MAFKVYMLKEAEKQLNGLPAKVQERIRNKLRALADFPNVKDCVKIIGRKDTYRLRVGGYRALFKVYSADEVIIITRIGPRGRIYKGL
jgi:mRNA interferase RelE/StbE